MNAIVRDADPVLIEKIGRAIPGKHSTIRDELAERLGDIRANPKGRQGDLLGLDADVMAAADEGEDVPL